MVKRWEYGSAEKVNILALDQLWMLPHRKTTKHIQSSRLPTSLFQEQRLFCSCMSHLLGDVRSRDGNDSTVGGHSLNHWNRGSLSAMLGRSRLERLMPPFARQVKMLDAFVSQTQIASLETGSLVFEKLFHDLFLCGKLAFKKAVGLANLGKRMLIQRSVQRFRLLIIDKSWGKLTFKRFRKVSKSTLETESHLAWLQAKVWTFSKEPVLLTWSHIVYSIIMYHQHKFVSMLVCPFSTYPLVDIWHGPRPLPAS